MCVVIIPSLLTDKTTMGVIKCSLLLLVLNAVHVIFGDGGGVVRSIMGNEEPPLECKYKHSFYTWFRVKGIKTMQTRDFTYNIHCTLLEGSPTLEKVVTITYQKHLLDKFIATSCKKWYIVNSIFPPKQIENVGETDNHFLPTTTHIMFIKEDGKCYDRYYKFKNFEEDEETEDTAPAKRLGAALVDCPEESSVAERFTSFIDCKVPTTAFSNIVFDWRKEDIKWWPTTFRIDPAGFPTDMDVHHEKLLSCTYEQKSHVFQLICLKVDGVPGYSVYVGEGDRTLLDRFNVTSCQEDDVIHGIFPPRYTVANPEPKGPIPSYTIKFTDVNSKCFEREYKFKYNQAEAKEPKTITCPSKADAWFHPTTGSTGIWEKCSGPHSNHIPIEVLRKAPKTENMVEEHQK